MLLYVYKGCQVTGFRIYSPLMSELQTMIRVNLKTHHQMDDLRCRIGMSWSTFVDWLWVHGADQLKAAAEKLEKGGSK